MALTVNDLREQYYKKKKEEEQATPASSVKTVDDLRQAYYQRKETQQTLQPTPAPAAPKTPVVSATSMYGSANRNNNNLMDMATRAKLMQTANEMADIKARQAKALENPRASTAYTRQTEKQPMQDRAQKVAEIRKDIDTTPVRTGLGAGLQSIGLSLPAGLAYGGATIKQGVKDTGEYLNTAEAQAYADAVAEFNRISKTSMEDSSEYLAALEKVNNARALLDQAKARTADAVDPNSRAAQFYEGYVGLQEEALKNTSGIGRDVAELALSVGNFASKLPLGPLAAPALAAEAAAGKMYDVQQAGGSAAQAVGRGAVSGAIEYFTEKIGIDNMMGIIKKTGGAGLWDVATQVLAEGGEEGLSYVFNWIADKVAGDPEAEFVWKDFLRSAAMGAASGGIIGSVATVANRVRLGETGKVYQDVAPELVAEGLQMSQDTDAYRTAAEMQRKLDAGKTLSNVDVGRVVQDNEAAAAPLKQAAMEMAEAEVKQRAAERTAAVSKSLGYGKEGARVFGEIYNGGEVDAKTLLAVFDTPYQAGLTGGDGKKYTDPMQIAAYSAGNSDRIAQQGMDAKAKPGKVFSKAESGFDYTNAPADLTQQQKNFGNLMAKTFGIKGNFVKGETAYNARYVSNVGEVNFAKDFGIDQQLMQKLGDMDFQQKVEQLANKRQQSFAFYVAHEIADHVAANRAPVEMRAFNNAMYNYLRETEGANLARERMAFYGSRGANLDTKGAIEEVAADSILMLYDGDEQKFMTAMERVLNGTDERAKRGAKTWGEALKNIIEKLKAWARKLTGRDNAQAKADVEKSVAELERLRDMFEAAIAKAAQNVEMARTLENRGGQEYNGSKGDTDQHSLKNGHRAQRGRSIELETMENNRFERLRQFGEYLPEQWYAYTGGYFYIYSNHSFMNYTLLAKVAITEKNRADISAFEEDIENGTFQPAETFSQWTSYFRRGKGRYSWDRVRAGNRGAAVQNDGVDERARGSKHTGHPAEGGGVGEVKFSLKDQDYMNAVNAGDMETAQRMVDEAAKAAGYDIKAWHGSRYLFNEFSKDKRGSNTRTKTSERWFFAGDKDTANSYYPYGVMKELARQNPGIWKDSDAEKMKQKGKLYGLYLKMDNPLVVDVAGYDYAAHIQNKDAMMEYVEQAERDDNDGIILIHVRDNQLKPSAEESTVYMFRESAQAKLADPVTYDDSGNVIPLSKRFNTESDDIRYSLKVGDETATYEEDGKRFSLKSLRHDIAEGRMFDDLVTAKVFNQKEADLLKQNLDKLVSYMLPNAGILDMNEAYGKENRPYSAYKPNSDPLYVISLDFSTLCRKRLMTQYVIEQLQLRENRPMSAEEQIAIRSMLLDYRRQDNALQVACAMCYVEAARLKAPKQMERFFNDTEAIMRKYFAKKDKAFNDKVREAQAKFKRDHGYDENATKKDMSGKDTKALNEMSARMRKEYTPDAKQQAIIDKAKSLPRSTFLTAGNLTALAIDHPDIYAAYTDHIRASTRSKSLESDIPYYYGDSEDMVSDSFIDSVNAENGMRFDSWSDFQMKHMLDMITAVIDLSVRGSKMHGYTKFPEMVRIFGKTGMMFNLSGVTEGNGFDENGDLLFSSTEGIDIVEARKLLRDFPETAGLQCIGVSDDHIRALLRADYVDYVIPYHTSGMNATLRKMAGINNWKDYTSTQHARKDPKAKKPADADKWQVEPVWSEFYVPDGEDGFDIMEKTAQRYIDLCHERGLIPKFDQFMDEPGYWKLLVDRKMVNQKTGQIIEQQPVKPIFDFDLIKQEIDREVSQYDPQLEKRALKYVVDNFDAVHQRIKDLKKGHPKKPMLKMANELLQAYAEGSKAQFSLKGEQQMAKELKRIREEGKKAGKSAEQIRTEVAQIVGPEYAELLKTYGAIERGETPFRDIQVPERTGKNRKVSQTVRTILEAEATPDAMIPDVEALVAEGALSFESYTDEQAIADATGKLVRDGWSDTLRSWQEDNAVGKISKEHTVTGWALYNYAANEGDVKTALDVLDGMVRSQRNAAQALQATRVLKQLAPETQLYGVKRTVEKFQRDIDERSGDAKDVAELQREVGGARREAADKIRKAYSGAKVKGGKVVVEGNQAGEPFVFEYAEKVGEALAKSIAPKDSVKQQKTFLQQITSQLRRFASEKVQKTPGQKAMTATELLRDYIQNQSFYTEAWEAAQNSIRMQYADDERMSEFINSGIGVDATLNPKNAVFMQALVRAAAESKETRSMIVRQSSLGVTGMANNIAEQLIRETGAKGSMADTIRDAAAAYVNEVLRESDANQGDLVNASIKNAMHDVGTTLAKYITSTNSQKATIEQEIVSKLITKYSFGFTDATLVADVVRDHFNTMATAAARKNLANRFKKRAKTQKSLEQTMQELASLGAFDIGSAYNEAATEKVFKRGVKIKVNEELAQKFLAAETQEQRDAILEEIYADIGKQLPSTFMDKWKAWRYLAMLGNARTQVRNVAGNLFFAPVVNAKNLTATMIESVVSKAVPVERTKSMVGGTALTNVFNKDRPLIIGGKTTQKLLEAAWADYANVADQISNGGRYDDRKTANQIIEANRTIFENKLVEKARKGVSNAMEVGDVWFSQPHYAAALASYCKANDIPVSQIAKGGAVMDKARAYAIKEAQKATYRDVNVLSNLFSRRLNEQGEYGKAGKVVNMVVEGILPFRKTPANILARGLEYSPLGLLKSLTWDLAKVRKAADADKPMLAAKAIDNAAAGLTGTGLAVLGLLLAKFGLIRGVGEEDEKEREFAELQGHQAYSMELPGGTSVTLDWLAPEALPFFVGVNLWELTKGKKEEVNADSIINAVESLGAPMLELSCLQSLSEAIEAGSNAYSQSGSTIMAIATSATISLATQAFPTLVGQLERTFQKVRMRTYTDKNKRWIPSEVQYTLGKVSAKVPAWDYQQVAYVDAWGRTESTGSFVENAFNNLLNPAYTSKVETSDMEDELLRLYRATGDGGVLPKKAANYVGSGDTKKNLTKEEYLSYNTERGQMAYDILTELVESAAYKKADNAEKAKAVEAAYKFANETARKGVQPEWDKMTSWVKKADEAEEKYKIPLSTFVALKGEVSSVESLEDKDGKTISGSESLLIMEIVYDTPGLTDKQRQAMFEYLVVGKSVRHYNKSLVKQKLTAMRKNAK